ncbi:hypothetical protein [Granulicella sp. dw_53]|nr:hypothetical protein [Granulicella sp. dw_53]
MSLLTTGIYDVYEGSIRTHDFHRERTNSVYNNAILQTLIELTVRSR